MQEKPKCTHCGKFYHTIESCYELIGYLTGRVKVGNNGGKGKDPIKSAYLAAAGEDYHISGLSATNFAKLVQYFNTLPKGEHLGDHPTANMAGKMGNITPWVIDLGEIIFNKLNNTSKHNLPKVELYTSEYHIDKIRMGCGDSVSVGGRFSIEGGNFE